MPKQIHIKYGADPEVFSGYTAEGNTWVIPPAFYRKYLGIPFTDGDTRHPKFYNEDGIVVHEDGVAWEVTIPPNSDWREMLKDVWKAEEIAGNLITSYSGGKYSLFVQPTISYQCERWLKEDESFQQCLIFGCDPDRNAFNSTPARVEDVAMHPYRYGGGHIHISGHPLFNSDPVLAIQILAATAGLAASAYSPVPELERLRTYLYGKAGKFRVQHYPDRTIGVEYRTPSNIWSSKENLCVAEKIFGWIEFALEKLMSCPEKAEDLVLGISADLQDAILSCDQEKCFALLSYVEEEAK